MRKLINASKPSIFIGGSSEGHQTAHALKQALGTEVEARVWDEDIFSLGSSALDDLLKMVSIYDFGIFVCTEDDFVKSRGASNEAPRDNVILEIGFFMGALGKRRAFPVVVAPQKDSLKMPTDLLGNTESRLPNPSDEEKFQKAMAKTAEKLLKAIRELSEQSFLQLLPSTGLAVGYCQNFLFKVCSILADRDEIEVGDEMIDISDDNFDFNIVLPSTLSGASPQGAESFVKQHGLGPLNLYPLSGKGRPYPLHVMAGLESGRLQIFDYPTTLGASYAAIELALNSNSLGKTKDHEVLDKKEIHNFAKTISLMLQKPEAAAFSKNINFKQL